MKILIFFVILTIVKKGMILMSEMLNGVEVKSMSVIYAELIIDGVCTFKRVAKYFKSDTAVVLVCLGAEDKITDPAYLEEAKKRIAEHEAENNQ